ncbi:hypothetical protein Rpal_3328 [Rhodopseudomonas palustris TIE-1]|uniref:hypothetical protein n=1 Tax=Rhodopseudomonas palustris TaxID=1076 RepID=UPI0001779748|nr:hypothetical protein [Rhodopseudomonas palustris]ACF01830.1 hypothetical protein Rpal_3328 [Rhodopseudomonas palustris TIE-1]
MTCDVKEVLTALNTVIGGGEIDVDVVKTLRWSVAPEMEGLMDDIYRELIIFASDDDDRSRDRSYDETWRRNMIKWRDRLTSALERRNSLL